MKKNRTRVLCLLFCTIPLPSHALSKSQHSWRHTLTIWSLYALEASGAAMIAYSVCKNPGYKKLTLKTSWPLALGAIALAGSWWALGKLNNKIRRTESEPQKQCHANSGTMLAPVIGACVGTCASMFSVEQNAQPKKPATPKKFPPLELTRFTPSPLHCEKILEKSCERLLQTMGQKSKSSDELWELDTNKTERADAPHSPEAHASTSSPPETPKKASTNIFYSPGPLRKISRQIRFMRKKTRDDTDKPLEQLELELKTLQAEAYHKIPHVTVRLDQLVPHE